jgi:sigma-B regulation protein RsbU (phosphoserine phosphatase)
VTLNAPGILLEESAEELYEDAPCGYLATRPDGLILRVNRTFESWIGRTRKELVDRVRFQELLTAGGRIYYETHYAPLLSMQGAVREIAVDLVRGDGSLLPALINSVLRRAGPQAAPLIRTTVFDATDRRRYEQELLRASQREHEIAQQLQRRLLGGELPVSEHFELEVFYAPVGRGLAAGGDWYDAFWTNAGQLALVVGDVVGRGLEAAAIMGQLRSAVRAFASVGLRPSPLLSALDNFSRRHRLGVMATVVYAELDHVERSLRFVCAGHPPPLIAEPGQPPRFLWEGRSVPVNVFDDQPRPEAVQALSPGTTVVLYTDGLIEHRERSADDGMEQLSRLVDQHRTDRLQDLVQAVVRGLGDGAHDDRCLAAVRLRQ